MANEALIESIYRDYLPKPGIDSLAKYGALPIQNQVGEFQVGGDVGGVPGQIQTLFNITGIQGLMDAYDTASKPLVGGADELGAIRSQDTQEVGGTLGIEMLGILPIAGGAVRGGKQVVNRLDDAVRFLRKYGEDVDVSQLNKQEKSALTRFGNELTNPAVRRREGLIHTNPKTDIEISLPDRTDPPLNIEDLQGNVMVPVVGDGSLAGGTLKSVRGVPLSRDVKVQGGADFAFERKGSGAAWASMLGAARAKNNNLLMAAEKTGKDPVGVFSAMSPEGVDFSTPVAEAALAQLPALKIPIKDMKAFNSAVRNTVVQKNGKATKPFKDFVGINSTDVFDQILGVGEFTRKGAGDLRKGIVKEMSKARWREKGFPIIDDIRRAVTDSRLLAVDAGDSGLVVFDADPLKGLSPEPIHLSYDTQIPGEYKGTLGASIPPEVLFPDLMESLSKKTNRAGQPFTRDQQVGALRQAATYQEVNQRVVDSVSQYMEAIRRPTP